MSRFKISFLLSPILFFFLACSTNSFPDQELKTKTENLLLTFEPDAYNYNDESEQVSELTSNESRFSFFDWIFPTSIDKGLGKISSKILEKQSYCLDEEEYKEAYDLLNEIKNEILNSGRFKHANEFEWKIKIIDSKEANAFTFSGGYIYVHRGLFQELNNTDEMAGILAHEMMHSDYRHVVKNLSFSVGVMALVSLANFAIQYYFADLIQSEDGESTFLQSMSNILISVFTSYYQQSSEQQADIEGVNALSTTCYSADAFADFFDREQESLTTMERVIQIMTSPFVSHPMFTHRIKTIREHAQNINANKTGAPNGLDYRFQRIKKLIKKKI